MVSMKLDVGFVKSRKQHVKINTKQNWADNAALFDTIQSLECIGKFSRHETLTRCPI